MSQYDIRGVECRFDGDEVATATATLTRDGHQIGRIEVDVEAETMVIRIQSEAAGELFADSVLRNAPGDSSAEDVVLDWLLTRLDRHFMRERIRSFARRNTCFRLKGDEEGLFRYAKRSFDEPVTKGWLRLLFGERMGEICHA